MHLWAFLALRQVHVTCRPPRNQAPFPAKTKNLSPRKCPPLQDHEAHTTAGLHSLPDSIPRIAALTTHFGNSDVRVAIKTLYHAALEPQEDVEQVFQRARRDLTADVLANLDERCLLILRAALETPERFVKQVYSRYRNLSNEHHQDPFSYVHFYTNLSYLQSIGLILLVSTKVGRAYTNQIHVLFDRELLEAVCRVRWG
jgi:Cdc6-like AAA superfamily ATPase